MAPAVDEQGVAGEVPTALTAEEHGARRMPASGSPMRPWGWLRQPTPRARDAGRAPHRTRGSSLRSRADDAGGDAIGGPLARRSVRQRPQGLLGAVVLGGPNVGIHAVQRAHRDDAAIALRPHGGPAPPAWPRTGRRSLRRSPLGQLIGCVLDAGRHQPVAPRPEGASPSARRSVRTDGALGVDAELARPLCGLVPRGGPSAWSDTCRAISWVNDDRRG